MRWTASDSPGDRWYREAIAAGVPSRVAALGRELMRAAHVAGDEYLMRRCEPSTMMALALADPANCQRTWHRFLLGLDDALPSAHDLLAALARGD